MSMLTRRILESDGDVRVRFFLGVVNKERLNLQVQTNKRGVHIVAQE